MLLLRRQPGDPAPGAPDKGNVDEADRESDAVLLCARCGVKLARLKDR